MAQRPRSGAPDQTLLMDAVREAEVEITREMPPVVNTAPLPPSQISSRSALSRAMDAVRAADTETSTLPAVTAPGNPAAILPIPALPHAEVEQFQTQALPAINALHHDPASAPSGHYRSKEEIERSVAQWTERNDRWLNDNSWLDARKSFMDERMAAFHKRWKFVDAQWEDVDKKWRARHEDAVFGEELLTEVYEDGGTQVALGMVNEIAHQIAVNAAEKSARAELEVSQ